MLANFVPADGWRKPRIFSALPAGFALTAKTKALSLIDHGFRLPQKD